VDVVVEFGQSKGVGEKSYWMKLVIDDDRKDCSESIVGSVGFNHKLMIWKPMVKDQSTDEGLLQHRESRAAFIVEVPLSTLLGEPS